MLEVLLGAALLTVAAVGSSRGSGSSRATYTGVTCPNATSELVDWSTDSWWYPTLTTDIEWSEFRDAVELTPQVVSGSMYLPWQEGWEPWAEFLGRDQANWSESFYRTELPSGKRAYVWNASGVEHWFTHDGFMDVQREDELLARVYAVLEEWSDDGIDIGEEQVRQALVLARTLG
jgi:hypothetical protein